jgi:hypothetical protein
MRLLHHCGEGKVSFALSSTFHEKQKCLLGILQPRQFRDDSILCRLKSVAFKVRLGFLFLFLFLLLLLSFLVR